MKFLTAVIVLFSTFSLAQTQMEMTPKGFAPVTFATPDKPIEKLIEVTKAWAPYYNKKGYDITEVTTHSVTIDALREYACFYYNRGDRFDYNIRYALRIVFNDNKTCTVSFSANEFYAKQTLTETTVADFFLPDGRLKEEFTDVKPSLEYTAGKIVTSFVNFISN